MRPGGRLTSHEYDQRLDEIAEAFAGRYGEVEYGSAELEDVRRMEVRVAIPGYGMPTVARMVFIEKHVRSRGAWEMFEYLYDLRIEPGPSGRYAFHWHDDVPHRHCVDGRTPRPDHHYEGEQFDDIGWAAEQLFTIGERGISCSGLRPRREAPPEPDEGQAPSTTSRPCVTAACSAT